MFRFVHPLSVLSGSRLLLVDRGRRCLASACRLALAMALCQLALPANAKPVLTSTDALWSIPGAEIGEARELRIEGRIAYVDPRWRHLWIEEDGVAGYLLLAPDAPALQQNQHVVIAGTIVPAQGLEAARVTVSVVQADRPPAPLAFAGRIGDFAALHNRVVTGGAYVDSTQLIDDDHLRLSLIIDEQPVTAYVKPEHPTKLPDWAGRFVRVTALYQGRFDPTLTQGSIELWSARERDVVVTGSLASSQLFDVPTIAARDLHTARLGAQVKVRGRVMTTEPGRRLVLRDASGQVAVRTLQQLRVPPGSDVEAVGRLALVDAQWLLESSLFRVRGPARRDELAPQPEPPVLDTVERVRALDVDDAAAGHPVSVTGVVTWSMPDQDFFFLEDITGGVRVRFRPEQLPAPPRNKYLRVQGVTYNGGFAPAIELRNFQDLGALSAPPVKTITYDQAVTGQEDGQLVNLRGFYRSTEEQDGVQQIHVTTPAGEFVAVLKSTVRFAPTPGSLLRVHGVCEVAAEPNGRVSSIVVRVPSIVALTVEEDAPADPYALPLRTIRNLRQLNTARELTRVRVEGVTLYADAGGLIYLQDGSAGLRLLSREPTTLLPGDRVEVVGILGWEGVRTVVREAVYRKHGTAAPPQPVRLHDPARMLPGLDSRLVRVRGTLTDVMREAKRLRLRLQADTTIFEAVLEGADEPAGAPLEVGAVLDVTGVYRIGFDDSRRTRGFQLQLRSPADITVAQRARLLTLPRAIAATMVLAGCSLLAFIWVSALRRRVRRQTEQLRAQMERQSQLEAQVQHATRLESLGVLAGGIAHDFNNLLTIIMGNLGLAMLDARAMTAVGRSLEDAHRGALRARDLTQQLLTFAKGGDPLRATVALPGVVRETAGFVLHGSNCRCEYRIPADLWPADVDRAQVAQVVQNLVLNAMQATPQGGIIKVVLENEEIAAGAHPSLAAGRYLRLVISDQGHGIPTENLSRIFDPYFSTKKTGSGLGLATVYSIVKKHQGHIAVESPPGVGTTFTLWLPAAPPHAACAADGSARAANPEWKSVERAHVLLMDDEDSILQVAAGVLQRMNLQPTRVHDGAAALREFEAARAAGRPFSLLILDLTIPGGMGGREAIARIRALDPHVPAIVSSGYSNDPVLADFRQCGFQAMVTKPYDVLQLAETVRGLLRR
jgi:signal transduction histidine kinase/CheY-like chemotaxis protein